MARGVKRKDFVYEIDQPDNSGTIGVIARMLLFLDQFNVGTEDDKVKPNTVMSSPLINAHISLDKNKREFGIRPRYALLEFVGTPVQSACYGAIPKRFVQMPILTLVQFADLNIYDEIAGGTQAKTTLKINHSFDGSKSVVYKIIDLVNQIRV